MVSEKGSELTSQNATGEQKKEFARKQHAHEVEELMTTEAKWSQPSTIFDKLPAHEKPFPIEPFPNERQRLPFKMTDEDRLRRKAWVHSQELSDREPVNVPELETMIYNPIRRLYRTPTDKLFNALGPFIGEHRVRAARTLVPKLFLAYLGGCVLWYNFKFNKSSWEEKKGFTFIQTRGVVLPEDPRPPEFKKQDYYESGFQSRRVFKGDQYAY